MSLTDDLPEMDGADLLGLLFEDQDVGAQDALFSDGDMLIDNWLSEQDVSLWKETFSTHVMGLSCFLHFSWYLAFILSLYCFPVYDSLLDMP